MHINIFKQGFNMIKGKRKFYSEAFALFLFLALSCALFAKEKTSGTGARPVLNLSFENGRNDDSGFGNNVTGNQAVKFESGLIGRSALFSDGAYLYVPDSKSLNPTDALTLEAWIKPNPGYGEVRPRIFMKEQPNPFSGYSFSIQQRRAVFDCSINSKRASLLCGEDLPVNRWTHVAATFDGKCMRIYYNGILKASMDRPGKLTPANGADLTIGGWSKDDGRSIFGMLDNVRIYPAAKTSFPEIAAILAKIEKKKEVRINISGNGVPIADDIANQSRRQSLSGIYSVPVRWNSGNPLSYVNEEGCQICVDAGANTLILEDIPSLIESSPDKVIWEEPQDINVFKKFPSLKLFSGFMPWWQIKRPELLAQVNPAFRDEFMVTQNGVPVTKTAGALSPVSFWGPNTRAFSKVCMRDRIEKFGEMDQVIGWNIPSFQSDNFYHGGTHDDITDYSPHAQKEYRRWLKNVKHYTLDTLNAAYGTGFASWDKVKMPQPRLRTIDLRASWKDFQEFRRWSVREWYRGLIEFQQKNDPRKRDVVRMWISGGPPRPDTMTIPEDLFSLCDELKVYGFIEQTFGESSSSMRVKQLSLQYDYGLCSSETGLPSGFYRSMYQNAKCGCDMAFLKWIPPYLGHFRNPLCFSNIRRYRPSFMACSGGTPMAPEAKVALLYSYHTAFSKPRLTDLGAGLLEYLYEREYPYIYISDLAPLNKLGEHKSIVTAHCMILPPSVIEKLCKYVEGGGRLVLYADSGVFDTTDTDEKNPSYGIYRKLGFTGELDWTHAKRGTVALKGECPLFKGCDGVWMRNGWGVKLPEDWNGKVIASWENGDPAIITWPFGKGEVVMVGGEMPRATFASFMDNLGCSPLVKSDDFDVKGACLKKDGKTLLTLFNDSWETKNARCYPEAKSGTFWRDLKSGELTELDEKTLKEGLAIELEPQECRVISLEDKSQAQKENKAIRDSGAFASWACDEDCVLLPGSKSYVLLEGLRKEQTDKALCFETVFDKAVKGDFYFYLRGYEPAIKIGKSSLEYEIFMPTDTSGFEAFIILTGDEYRPQSTLRLVPGMCQAISPSFFRHPRPPKGKWEKVKIDLSKLAPNGISGMALLVRVNNPAKLANLRFFIRNIRLTNADGLSSVNLLFDHISCAYDLEALKKGKWTDTFCWGPRHWWKSSKAELVDANEVKEMQ